MFHHAASSPESKPQRKEQGWVYPEWSGSPKRSLIPFTTQDQDLRLANPAGRKGAESAHFLISANDLFKMPAPRGQYEFLPAIETMRVDRSGCRSQPSFASNHFGE